MEIKPESLIKTMLFGAAIGAAIISIFVFSVENPDPMWGKYWFIRPLIITPLVSSFGILSFYLKNYIRPQSAGLKLVVLLISTFAFIVSLWMGIILGLDGTLWN
ncbi:MAG: potassium transporter KefB [Bacteroidetes bacterium]|nr:MAG: potassium transporter KefB [Bacteroidota bacterium]